MTIRPGGKLLPQWILVAGILLSAAFDVRAAGASAAESARFFQWRPFLAPFHSVVLHFPIGFLTIAGLLEVYRVFRPSDEIRRVTGMILWLGLATGVVSAAFGLMRAGSGEYDPHMLNLHRVYGLAVPLMTLLTLALHIASSRITSNRASSVAYQLLLVGTLALVVVAGHFGGNLTHGSKYLVENAPDFVRELLDEMPADTTEPDLATLDVQARLFVEKVQPVLEKKCIKCHGADKQKGGFRLDQPELLFKPGESGQPPIKPGDVTGSRLVQLILLPPEHDDVMPPDGKEPLTIEEIATLLDWVRHGASVPASSTNFAASTNSSPAASVATESSPTPAENAKTAPNPPR